MKPIEDWMIWIVEDDLDICSNTCWMVEDRFGCRTRGFDAISDLDRALKHSRPDFLIADYLLKDGTLGQSEFIDRFASERIMVMSGNLPTLEAEQTLRTLKIKNTLWKPVDPQEFRHRLSQIVEDLQAKSLEAEKKGVQLKFDIDTMRVEYRSKHSLPFTATEYRILSAVAQSEGISQEDLIKKIWGEPSHPGNQKTLQNSISKIRKRLHPLDLDIRYNHESYRLIPSPVTRK